MEDLCKKLPDDEADKCAGLVDKFFPLIKLLLQHASPDFVCEHLHFCDKKTDMASLAVALGGFAGPLECTACKFAINELKKKLTDKDLQKKVLSALVDGCDSLPVHSLGDNCKDLVKKYGPKIIAEATAKVDESWCTHAGAC